MDMTSALNLDSARRPMTAAECQPSKYGSSLRRKPPHHESLQLNRSKYAKDLPYTPRNPCDDSLFLPALLSARKDPALEGNLPFKRSAGFSSTTATPRGPLLTAAETSLKQEARPATAPDIKPPACLTKARLSPAPHDGCSRTHWGGFWSH
mmetsp:Transcript_119130/g.186919  ORF Transcript_119130/g.186919 Transcript_119130/m.186919 type:complete len:151 (-) Transcript_119130:91-543(-)